ncbi:MAG: Nramp family divalent metal transporter [Candidatus Dormibacteraeota bacterium]|nr:Nramp family divalent metal transporter [Candidatus Dormibacteraeota bacterium]
MAVEALPPKSTDPARATKPPVTAPDPVAVALPGEERVLRAAEKALNGQTRGLRALLPFMGPAFVASVAYVDPGNFATNIAGGAQYGYMLLWVVLAANLMAMLVQSMSAKLGIATGLNLAEVCRQKFPFSAVVGLWIQAEVIAMATDLAEFIGAAIGIHLLFPAVPLFAAGIITAIAAFGILAIQSRGFRGFEAVITGLVGVIVAAFAFEVILARPSVSGVAAGLFTPRFDGTESVLLGAGILGATVMPHVIYLHSALTQRRVVGATDAEQKKIFSFERWDVIIAMSLAGIINIAMLTIAAAVFHGRGISSIHNLDQAFAGFGVQLGNGADIFFGLGLLASGLSSSSVGTLAGQVVMQGFIRRQIPLFLRRAITMAPALVVIAIGLDPTRALVLSQVVLSFGIPFALIPLLMFCRDRGLMGSLVNHRATTLFATGVVAVIVSLNVFLIGLLVSGH